MTEAGHNNPPTDPFEECQSRIDDLYNEAKNWLDGEEVDSEKSAEGISTLLNMLRKAEKEAEDARKTEKAPHLEASKAVDAKYKPLSERVKLATDACKKALAPWLKKKQAEKDEAERIAREEAERKRKEAEAFIQSTPHDHLAAREEAEAKVAEAKDAAIAARKVAKEDTNAKAAVGRAVGLRSEWIAELTDGVTAARHYWQTPEGKDEITRLVEKLAARDVRRGVREIPGFEVRQEQKVA